MPPIIPILAIIAVIFGLSSKRRKDGPPGPDAEPMTPGGDVAPEGAELDRQLVAAFERVISDFGVPVAENVERIYRLETADFTSGQFRKTNTAGMHAFNASFPFGWSLAADGLTPNDFLPTIAMNENAGGSFQWVVFRNLGEAIHFLGYFLNKYGNNAGRWKSTEPDQQRAYIDRLSAVDPKIVRSLTQGVGAPAPKF